MHSNKYCPICGSKKIGKAQNKLSRCKECSLQFLTNFESPEYYNQIYNKNSILAKKAKNKLNL